MMPLLLKGVLECCPRFPRMSLHILMLIIADSLLCSAGNWTLEPRVSEQMYKEQL